MTPTAVRRPWMALVGLVTAAVVAVLVVVLAGGSGGAPVSASGIADAIPGDALAYVSLSLDRSSPTVRQALAVGHRLPNFSLGGTEVLGRLGEVLAGGRAVDVSSQILPWAGPGAALALLNTPTSTAQPLVVVQVANRARARAFLRAEGAVAHGSYRGVGLRTYPNGETLAFVGSDLVAGQTAGVHAAINAASGAARRLTAVAAYRRATAAAQPGSVLSAYASAAGVQRVLAGQGGALGSLGGLLSTPGLQAVYLSTVPTADGLHVRIHSALSAGGATATGAFAPTLTSVVPAGVSLMLDVHGLDRIAPAVLNAGSATGVAGGLGPLLTQLGTALKAIGVNVQAIESLFSAETAVAILGTGRSSTLMIAAPTANPAAAEAAFAQLPNRLGRLKATSGKRRSASSLLTVHRVAGVTVHQFQLTPTLALDYAVFRGLVVIATGPEAIADIARHASPVAQAAGFRQALAGHPARVTSLGYGDLGQLVTLGALAESGSATFTRLLPDLKQLGAAGLTSTRSPGSATTDLSIQVR